MLMGRISFAMAVAIIAVAFQSGRTSAQDPPTPPPAPDGPTPSAAGRSQSQEPKPYTEVITKDARTDDGVFTVHRIREKVYYEIPMSEFGTEFLWVGHIARTTMGVGFGGEFLGSRVVKWELMNNRVLLKSVQYGIVSDKDSPIAKAVQAANNDTIIMSFNVEAIGKDGARVIETTRLFVTDVPEFSARSRLRARALDNGRTFIERVASFPQNIEVEATQTYTSGDAPGPPDGPGRPGFRGMSPGSATVVVHFSMVKLPEEPMRPRLFDQRVGYFFDRQYDYSKDEQRAPAQRFIWRWRLDKKDPSASVSPPVKPIVFWIDPATPEKWIPYVKKGVDAWQPAFEKAGFKNAIVVKDAPSLDEDPDWSPEDARYSVIRWLPSTDQNAYGPSIHDPRTGEILDADVQIHHNVMNLMSEWYFLQVGPLDPRAQKLPLPDDLMGNILTYVVSHEVGHTLGLQHNMKASSTYPSEKLHDVEWLKTMGHVASVMDYARFNYIAQPEDKIDPIYFIPGIGPYDRWALMWGYKPIPEARRPEDEKITLDSWAREQDATPWLRFSTQGSPDAEPELLEAIGDADAVRASTLGMKNLERVSAMLLTAATKPGEPYDDLAGLYGRMLGQWALEMNHVAGVVGGFDSQQKHGGQEGVRFSPIAKQRQAAAVQFLNANAFKTPSFILQPDILRRIEASGVLDRIKNVQQRILNTLLSRARFTRLVEQQAMDGVAAYSPTAFLADLRKGIWSELASPRVKIDAYRRNTQRLYLDTLADRLNGAVPAADDARAFIRGELRALNAAIREAIVRTADRESRLHLEDAQDQITKALDPKFVRPAVAPVPQGPAGAGLDDSVLGVCFPDYGF